MATGFFGKLPANGDFVARNLAPGLRPVFDRWLTLYFARHARHPDLWPDTGIRGVIDRPDGTLYAVLVLPSRDAAGRQFPLGLFAPGSESNQDAINCWADTACRIAKEAIASHGSADNLVVALSENADPEKTGHPLKNRTLWSTGPPMDDVSAIRAFFPNSV